MPQKPTDPWAVVKTEPVQADDWKVVDPSPAETPTLGSTAEDFLIGVGKGAANTAIGLGELVHKIPGVSAAIDAFYGMPGLSAKAFPVAREAVKPTTTAQKVGNLAEQTGEFFTPVGEAGKIGKLGEIAKNAVLSTAQTGSPTTGVVSGALTAAIPGAAGLKKASSGLESSAEKTVVRALAPTTAEMKVTASELAPEMLKRGIGGSIESMQSQAIAKTKAIGQQLGEAYTEAAKRGDTILGQPILGAIEDASKSLSVPDAKGIDRMIPGTEAAHKALDNLHGFVSSMGEAIPLDKAAVIRRRFDDIVSEAGLYGSKVGASATDKSKAWATREAANAFRGLINSRDATIQDLNREFTFWKGLQDVTEATAQRKAGQGGGLTAAVMGSGGLALGSAAGGLQGGLEGLGGGTLIYGLTKLMQSPAFRTKVSAPLKNMLADALASGNTTRIAAITKSLVAALPAEAQK